MLEQIEKPTEFVKDGAFNLAECVKYNFKNYILSLDNTDPKELHELFVSQVESVLIDEVLKWTGGNECKAAKYLGIARGTLRSKRKKYNLERKREQG
ncbi:MAG: helix-turn-helix domain-containing protein [Pseudomonadota bacterium]